MKTYVQKPAEVIRKWYIVDAKGKTLGRFATKVATLLHGKHKTYFSSALDCGDFVIVINAGQIKLTGNKMADKLYRHHSKYKGGLKETSAERMLARKPCYPLLHAIKGMVPNNKMRNEIMKRLKIYAGAEHPHEAQKPEKID